MHINKIVSTFIIAFFCTVLSEFQKACFEHSILELWAVNGKFSKNTEKAVQNLTKDKIVDRINNENFRYCTIFFKNARYMKT